MRDRVPLVSKVLLVAACVTFVSLAESVRAEPPPETTVQGRLLDPAGNPRVGPVDMRVRIFGSPAPASGEPTLYEEEHLGVALVDGIFDLALGAGSPLVGTFEAGLFAEANRYVEFVVNGETLSPRQPLGSVPFALQASNAQRFGGLTPDEFVEDAIGGPAGSPLAVHLFRDSGDLQYIVPSGKTLLVEQVLFSQAWETRGDPLELYVHHSISPGGTIWTTAHRFFSVVNTLPNPLVIPAGRAVGVPSRTPADASQKAFLYGRLLDATDPTRVVIEIPRDGEGGGNRYRVPSGKSLVVEHIMFNQWWERSGEPMELLVHPLHYISGPAWVTRRRYHGALDTPPRPLVLPEDSAVSVPLRASNGVAYKVFLYGRLVDEETASPP